jgi:hypothetical protein
MALVLQNLTDFILELRRQGYRISTGQYISSHRLLVALAAFGDSLEEPKRLSTLLAPILCTSPAEQESFHQLFKRWLSGLSHSPDEGERLAVDSVPQPIENPPKRSGIFAKFGGWAPLVLFFVGLVLAGVVLSSMLAPEPSPQLNLSGRVVDHSGRPLSGATITLGGVTVSSRDDGSFTLPYRESELPSTTVISAAGHQDKTISINNPSELSEVQLSRGLPDTTPTTSSRLGLAVYGLFTLLVLGTVIVWSLKARRRLQLKKLLSEKKFQAEHLIVKGAGEQLSRILTLRRVAQELRRHRQPASRDLDTGRTVKKTIEAGLFTPVYTSRRVSPEYLVLLDRANFSDQQARMHEEVIRWLTENGVYIDSYFYQGDPRLCMKEGAGTKHLTVKDLAALYPSHDLVIFNSGEGLFNPLTGDLQGWLDLFSVWANRAVLLPEPCIGDHRSALLSRQGFNVLPTSRSGLLMLGEVILTGADRNVAVKGEPARLPTLLQDRPYRWVENYEPQAEILNQLFMQLREYLGDEGYFWLSACAVYPMLLWDLTLYLGHSLVGQSRIARTLPELMCLPWFTYGRMPDWFRRRLIFDLPPAREAAVRKALEDLLKTAILSSGNFVLPVVPWPGAAPASSQQEGLRDVERQAYRARTATLIQDYIKSEPKDSILREQVFLTFMNGFKQDRLSVLIPREVRSFLLKQDESDGDVQRTNAIVLSSLILYAAFFIYVGASAGAIEIPALNVLSALFLGAVFYYLEYRTLRAEQFISDSAADRRERAQAAPVTVESIALRVRRLLGSGRALQALNELQQQKVGSADEAIAELERTALIATVAQLEKFFTTHHNVRINQHAINSLYLVLSWALHKFYLSDHSSSHSSSNIRHNLNAAGLRGGAILRSGRIIAELTEILADTFEHESFENLLFKTGITRRTNLSKSIPFSKVVGDTLDTAASQGWISRLVYAAIRERPDVHNLRGFDYVIEFFKEINSKPDSPVDKAVITQSDEVVYLLRSLLEILENGHSIIPEPIMLLRVNGYLKELVAEYERLKEIVE